LTQGSAFALDYNKYVISNTWYMITGENLEALISFLNSNIIKYAYHSFYSTQLGTKWTRWLYQHIINLPIPKDIKDHEYNEKEIQEIYWLTEEEIKFISSLLNP
jgi:hypothetical protein